MQEEVNEKTISLCIKGGKITAQILKAALIKLLAEMDKKKQRGKGEKSQCKKTGRQSSCRMVIGAVPSASSSRLRGTSEKYTALSSGSAAQANDIYRQFSMPNKAK